MSENNGNGKKVFRISKLCPLEDLNDEDVKGLKSLLFFEREHDGGAELGLEVGLEVLAVIQSMINEGAVNGNVKPAFDALKDDLKIKYRGAVDYIEERAKKITEDAIRNRPKREEVPYGG